jgi:predicted enzyme related to lactoylglutathione lyase
VTTRDIEALDAVWVHIRNIKRARTFYRDVLGLKEVSASDKGQWAMYKLPGGPFLGIHRQFPGEPGRKAGTVTGLYLRVKDVEKAVRAIERRGGKITDRPFKLPWGDTHATVADPDGNEISLSTKTKPFRPWR